MWGRNLFRRSSSEERRANCRGWSGLCLVRAGSLSTQPARSRSGSRTLARAHARSGDPAAIAGYMGKGETFDDAIVASFAMFYPERTFTDYAALLRARDASFVGGRRPAD
ncbi:DUF2252 family protein [Methylocystis parvus]|uniref:DUF2252 domain-containing protein n=1 Tax=Methylocystis parvus TaxID=134 RepID=A0A6B8MBP1_9HYPH|nr:DUF2252 domain-containing protein [Methylocystis parvus]